MIDNSSLNTSNSENQEISSPASNSSLATELNSFLTKEEESVSYSLIEAIGNLLTNICEENTDLVYINSKRKKAIKSFSSNQIPSISINDYLFRLVRFTEIEQSTLIMTLIFIDRFCQKNKAKLDYYNIYKIILSALTAAISYNEEAEYKNEFLSRVGGIPLKEMNILQYNFLILIDFELFVDEKIFFQYYNQLQLMRQ